MDSGHLGDVHWPKNRGSFELWHLSICVHLKCNLFVTVPNTTIQRIDYLRRINLDQCGIIRRMKRAFLIQRKTKKINPSVNRIEWRFTRNDTRKLDCLWFCYKMKSTANPIVHTAQSERCIDRICYRFMLLLIYGVYKTRSHSSINKLLVTYKLAELYE